MRTPLRPWRVGVGVLPALVLAVVLDPSWLLVGALLGPVLLSWVDLLRDLARPPVEVVPPGAGGDPSGVREPRRPLVPLGGLTVSRHP